MSKSRSQNVSTAPRKESSRPKQSVLPSELSDPSGQVFGLGGWVLQGWNRFWFSATDPIALHVLRVMACLLFLLWLLPLAGHVQDLYSLQGWFDETAYAETSGLEQGSPVPLSWSIFYLCGNDSTLLAIAYWASIAVIAVFALGLWTRVTAVLTWVVVVSFTANPAASADIDVLMILLSLYLMIGYLLHGQMRANQTWRARILGSRDTWLFRRNRETQPSVGANLAVRLIQLHIAIVICVSGFHKLSFGDWWSGMAFWYPLHPPFETTQADIRALQMGTSQGYFVWLSLCAYLALAWQIAFPIYAWRPRWRVVLLGGALIGVIGSWALYEEATFGLALAVGCLSYLGGNEWRWVFAQLARGIQKVRSIRGSTVSVPQRADLAMKA